MTGRRLASLVLCGPWGPALAAAVFSVLVMALGGQPVEGLDAAVAWLSPGALGVPVAVLAGVGGLAAVAVALPDDRRVVAVHALVLVPSTLVAVAAASVVAQGLEGVAYDGSWTEAGRAARAWAVGCMLAGFPGLASLRAWRRHTGEALAGAPLGWTPDDLRGAKVALGLDAIALVGLVVG